jgi:aspartokinase
MLIINNSFEKTAKQIIGKELIKKEIRNLCSITIHLSEKAISTMGLFYIATKELNWENINIIDIVSTYTEMTFIIDEDDASKAYRAIKNMLSKNNN